MIIHYLSASRLKKYLQCSEAYHQAYENKVRSDAVHLRFGTMMHTVFERWFQEDIDILEIYEEEWKQADVVELQYYKDGIEICNLFTETNNKDEITSIGFEYPFAINIMDDIIVDTSHVDFKDGKQVKAFLKTLEEDDKAYIFGFIDRIDYNAINDTLYIVDYKTSRIPLTRDEANSDEQLSMYALVAKYIYPEFENVVLQLQYVRFGDIVSTTRTDEELEIFKQWLIDMYYIIKNDVSPKATINKYCGWCDAKESCAAYQSLVSEPLGEQEDVATIDFDKLDSELDNVSAIIKVLSDRKKEIEARFKEELKNSDNAPISANGKNITVRNNMRASYDVSTVITAFPDEFDKLLTVKKADVDKLAKGNDEVMQALEETSTKFYISPTLTRKKSK